MENKTDREWKELEYKARSLFSPAAPIDRAQLFAGRTMQIDRLINAIFERGRHAVLYGERGVGKTSLTNIFQELVGKISILTVRKQCSPEDDYISIWKTTFRELTYNVKTPLGYGKEETTQHSIADKYTDNITPDDVIRELRNVGQKIPIVIIFDEFDKIGSSSAKKLISHTIKAISDSGINATLIIVGVADDINTLVEEHESVKRNLEEIKMPRMSNEELNEILNKYLPSLEMEIEKKALWKVITLARGLPEYIHLLGRNAAIQAIKTKNLLIKETHIDNAIKEMIIQSDQSSNNTYLKAIHSNKANALYRQVLLAAAMAKTDNEGRFTLTSIIEPLDRVLGRKMAIAGFQSHIAAFCTEERGSILEREGSPRAYKYRFREPKMQPYVLMQGISSGIITSSVLSVIPPS